MLKTAFGKLCSKTTYYNKLESEVITIRRDNIMSNEYKEFRSDKAIDHKTFQSAPKAPQRGLTIMELTGEQWNALKVFSRSTSYGDNCQFWNDEGSLKAAPKRITLNGAPLRANTGIESQVIGRIPSGIMKGKLCILSGKVLKDAGVVMQVGRAANVVRSDL